METNIKKVIFSLKNNQFIVLPNETFLIPKYKNIFSSEDITNNINSILVLDDEKWKKQDVKLIFDQPEEVKGKKVIHFRVSRRNSRHKKKGFRARYYKTK